MRQALHLGASTGTPEEPKVYETEINIVFRASYNDVVSVF